jgi:3-oxoadipate CoA-transferase alpha subunit
LSAVKRARKKVEMKKIAANVAEALSGIKEGSQILIGGFGSVGQPDALLAGLIESGAGNLTLVMNNAGGVPGRGVSRLLELGRVRKMICSFPRSGRCNKFAELYSQGKIELELVPQGTLAERIRAAGAGIGAFFTPTAAGTALGEGKETRELNGVLQVMELPIFGDVALVQAWRSDTLGNLTYRGTSRNFNPLMAAAAKLTIVQTNHLVELGEIDPETIITPGVYVNRIVHVPDALPS